MDNRRVYEIYPAAGAGAGLESIQDFEGRKLEPGGEGALTITGAPARIILRWRFAGPRAAVVNGRTIPAVRTSEGMAVEFDHTATTTVNWR
jgi:hypothetical protein